MRPPTAPSLWSSKASELAPPPTSARASVPRGRSSVTLLAPPLTRTGTVPAGAGSRISMSLAPPVTSRPVTRSALRSAASFHIPPRREMSQGTAVESVKSADWARQSNGRKRRRCCTTTVLPLTVISGTGPTKLAWYRSVSDGSPLRDTFAAPLVNSRRPAVALPRGAELCAGPSLPPISSASSTFTPPSRGGAPGAPSAVSEAIWASYTLRVPRRKSRMHVSSAASRPSRSRRDASSTSPWMRAPISRVATVETTSTRRLSAGSGTRLAYPPRSSRSSTVVIAPGVRPLSSASSPAVTRPRRYRIPRHRRSVRLRPNWSATASSSWSPARRSSSSSTPTSSTRAALSV